MKVAARKSALNALGWRTDTDARYHQAVYDFRAMEPGLRPGRKAGLATQRRLKRALGRKRAGLPTLNRYYSHADFSCKCRGQYRACKRIAMRRRTVARVTRMSRWAGRRVGFISAYRCWDHNRQVGGATLSQHPRGRALDIETTWRFDTIKARRMWTGIGIVAATGRVAHVDTRPGFSVSSPVTWFYR